MKNKKVIILGAGPAGIAAAFILKKNGIDCLLFDKNPFPKDKCCGGMLTEKTVDLMYNLGFDLDEKVIKNVIRKVNLKYDNDIVTTINLDSPMYMTNRSELDFSLFKNYQFIGGEFKVCKSIKFADGGRKTVTIDGVDYDYDYLVAATGARGFVYPGEASMTFLEGIALEGNCDIVEDNETVDVEILKELNGYAWRFPKTSHENLGYGFRFDNGCRPNSEDVKQKYLGGVDKVRGAYLRVGNRNTLSNKEYNILRVGDCAGTVDAVTGEGIYYALKSGYYAALAILSGANAIEIYNRDMMPLIRRIESSASASKAFYKHKALVLKLIMKKSKTMHKMFKFVTDEIFSRAKYDYHKHNILKGYLRYKGK